MPKVFSVDDFRRGLDVRRMALTAPGGSLRILENALINPGGEIEKRMAFVHVTTAAAPDVWTMAGRFDSLHVFGCPTAPVIPPGTMPIPIIGHNLEAPPGGVTITFFQDVENYSTDFVVMGQGSDLKWYTWYQDALIDQPPDFPLEPSLQAYFAKTYKTKVYYASGFAMTFSGINNPAMMVPEDSTYPGAGFIDLAKNDPLGGQLTQGMEVFYNQMAVFSRLSTQLWTLDPDPNNDTLVQVLRTGTPAAQTIKQLFNGDLLYLSDSGIRNLRAQTVNVVAAVNDVGSAVDPLVVNWLLTHPFMTDVTAEIQPTYGRYWMHLPTSDTEGDIYALSYFPAGEITAWSILKPGFRVRQFAVVEDRLVVRDTTGKLYLYGGPSKTEYDSCLVRVRTPHLDSDKPTEFKRVQSIDVACEGTWLVKAGMLTTNLDAFEQVATIVNSTFAVGTIPFAGYGTHLAYDLTHSAPGPAKLAAIHANLNEGWTK